MRMANMPNTIAALVISALAFVVVVLPCAAATCAPSIRYLAPKSAYGSSYYFPVNTNYPIPGCGIADSTTPPTAFGVYRNMTTDYSAPSVTQVLSTLDILEKTAQGEVRFYNSPSL